MGRVLHIDCFSGISGDMALAALLDLGAPEPMVQEALGSLGLNGTLVVEKVRKNGFAATKIRVQTQPEHKHRHLSHILAILEKGRLSAGARELAKKMFERLGAAEAASHGIPIEKVHFHEVGAVDSIFDFVGVAVALDYFKFDRVTCRPVPTGVGFVDCEHGRLPVPAPAVARLLAGIPLAASSIETELTTPTGAAIVATMANEFLAGPRMTIEKVGVGAGTRDLAEQPNVLRLFFGSETTAAECDLVCQLETNLDDATGEQVGYCRDRLLEAGALDVFTTAIQMKKGRPGILLSVLCPLDQAERLERILFEETGTFGVRRRDVLRSKLLREVREVETPFGKVRGKLGWSGAVRLFAPEYEDCAARARERGVPLPTIYQAAREAFARAGDGAR